MYVFARQTSEIFFSKNFYTGQCYGHILVINVEFLVPYPKKLEYILMECLISEFLNPNLYRIDSRSYFLYFLLFLFIPFSTFFSIQIFLLTVGAKERKRRRSRKQFISPHYGWQFSQKSGKGTKGKRCKRTKIVQNLAKISTSLKWS